MKDKLKKFKFLVELKKSFDINKSFNNDKKLFKKYWIKSKTTPTKLGYSIVLDVHSIEKGMTSNKPRRFGKEKISDIISYLEALEKFEKIDNFYYFYGINCLKSYCSFYEKKNWDATEEYIKCKAFLDERNLHNIREIPVGINIISKSELEEGMNFDYNSFLSTRHSVRNFSKNRINLEDVKKAIEMTLKTPTACNRQMCKIYYIENEVNRKKVIEYGKGLTNFDLENVNVFLITYDISSFCFVGDRNQGMFNSGLVSMNFVNSLHSIGIGSCFIQFGNDLKEENELKKICNIPESEKIAVMVVSGYYDNQSVVPLSSRKNIEEILVVR